MINRRKSFIFVEKIKEMDRGFEILINMLVGQYGHEWGEMLNIFEKEKFVCLKKMYYICRC